MSWNEEQEAQRREWDLENVPEGTLDPVQKVLRSVPLPEPEPPPEVELPSASVDIASISTEPPPPMLVERLDPEGHTILFGTGGVGKGALACHWISELVKVGHGVLIVDYEAHPAEWSRRISSLAPDVHASGRVRHYSPREPLRACAEAVADEARTRELSVVVVDSAVMACGSDPLKPEVAGEYAAAIMRLGMPVLSLAHVTKADDMRYPFGSIFWHNLARTTWGLQQEQSGSVVLSHRKHNNYEGLGRFAVVSTWHDGKLREVYEKGYGLAIRERLTDVLGDGAMGIPEIVEALNGDEYEGSPVKRNSVIVALRRGIEERVFTVTDKRYSVA